MYSLDTLSEINFELSSHCNSKCPQCPRYDIYGNVHKDLNVTNLSLEIIKKLPLKKLKNLTKVSFAGNFGDPLMHPELDEIINFFKEQKIIISTNASLRNKTWWSNLGKNKNITVIFCIDGIGKEHELYRRNTSYKKIVENAKSFIQSGGTAQWQFIVFQHNEHQINEAKELSVQLGFKDIKFMYSDRFDTDDVWKVYDNNKYLYDLKKSSKQTTLKGSLNVPLGEKYWKSLNKNKGEISCFWSESKKIYIHSDGTVYPCCMLGSVQSGKNIEKLMLKKIIKDYKEIDLNYSTFEQIIISDILQKTLPETFKSHSSSHPVCIEWCNKNSGKYSKKHLNNVNI
jgi:MoaA/NifB/PqqE/SkfB family radical SAM enzyme